MEAVISHATPIQVNNAGASPAAILVDLDATTTDLGTIAERVRNSHAGVGAHMRSALGYALVAGAALATARKRIKHGSWIRFVEADCDLSIATAERYLKIHKHRSLFLDPAKSSDLTNLSLAGALRLIFEKTATPPPAEPVVDAPDEAAILAKRAEHTIAAPIVGSWAAKPAAASAAPTPAPEPDLSAWLDRDKDELLSFLKAALGTIELDDLLAALPSGWNVEIDRRVVDQHAAKRSPLGEKLTKALRSALSQSRTDQGKNGAVASLNGIHKMFAANGLDLHDVELTAGTKRKRAKAA